MSSADLPPCSMIPGSISHNTRGASLLSNGPSRERCAVRTGRIRWGCRGGRAGSDGASTQSLYGYWDPILKSIHDWHAACHSSDRTRVRLIACHVRRACVFVSPLHPPPPHPNITASRFEAKRIPARQNNRREGLGTTTTDPSSCRERQARCDVADGPLQGRSATERVPVPPKMR